MTTYNKAGVNIKRADEFVNRIKIYIESTRKHKKASIVCDIGGFASVRRTCGIIVGMATDGVGSKVCMAAALDHLDTIGEDLVAMNANDLSVTMEPEESFFQDCYSVGKLSLYSGERIIEGIARGCRLANTELTGGETAEMPALYSQSEFDITGTIIGIAKSESSVTKPKNDIRAGMGIFGYRSSGVHANGFALIHKTFEIDYTRPSYARKILDTYYEDLDKRLGDELMTPTTIYTDKISRLRRTYDIAGFAHITGGGLKRNIPRILPPTCNAVLKMGSWTQHPIFGIIARVGNVSQDEMLNIFNCGIGLVVICDVNLVSEGFDYIGDIVAGEGALRFI